MWGIAMMSGLTSLGLLWTLLLACTAQAGFRPIDTTFERVPVARWISMQTHFQSFLKTKEGLHQRYQICRSLESQFTGNATHKMLSVYGCTMISLCHQDSLIYMTIPFMDVIFMGSLRYVALTIAVWLKEMQSKLQCYNLRMCSGSICMRFLC